MASATFTGPQGQDPVSAIHMTVDALTTITQGDLLYVGQVFRSRIRQRTFSGVDVNNAPFAPYSERGPYYFYPNGEVGAARGAAAQARATAAKNRFNKTGKIGTRTPYGIRYESYAAAKAAHGVGNVNLYGMEQHPHMLDSIIVRVEGSEVDQAAADLDFGSELAALEGGKTAATELTLGFYGEEADRAKGHNEGNRYLPVREFFALNQEDLQLAETAIGERMEERAKAIG